MIKLRYKVLAIGGTAGLLLLWLHFKHPVQSVNVVSGHKVNTSFLRDYGHGDVVVNNHGVVTVTPKVYGFPFDIGASSTFGSNNIELYLTTEVFFYRHFELLTGIGSTYPIFHPRIMLALGYRLPWKRVDNISLFVGHNTQYPIVGIYARFGSN